MRQACRSTRASLPRRNAFEAICGALDKTGATLGL